MFSAHQPLSRQTIVITGATSGIGLTTARNAAAQGANVVLAARNGAALADVVASIVSAGEHAIGVEADVGIRPDVQRIADRAVAAFGGIDTWVNNAGITIYAASTKSATAITSGSCKRTCGARSTAR